MDFYPIFVLFGLVVAGVVFLRGAVSPKKILPSENSSERRALWLGAVIALGLAGLIAKRLHQGWVLNEPMAIAAMQGDIKKVVSLLDRGASPDSYGVDYNSPALVDAAKYRHAEVVRVLLSRGANPNLKDRHGLTALRYVRERGDAEMEKALLAAGAKE